jgi:hypothetical protein
MSQLGAQGTGNSESTKAAVGEVVYSDEVSTQLVKLATTKVLSTEVAVQLARTDEVVTNGKEQQQEPVSIAQELQHVSASLLSPVEHVLDCNVQSELFPENSRLAGDGRVASTKNLMAVLATNEDQLSASSAATSKAQDSAQAVGARSPTRRRPRRPVDPIPTRQSERQKAMANADAPVANRAELLKKVHNLETLTGNKFNTTNFVVSIPDKTLAANFSILGVSLGKNDLEIKESINQIKISEVDRFATLYSSAVASTSNVDKNNDELLKLSSLQHLCSDWLEEAESNDDESMDSQAIPRMRKISTKVKHKVVCPLLTGQKRKLISLRNERNILE